MEQEKMCENCKFFLLHYVKSETKFTPIAYGHCTNQDIPWKVRKHNMPRNNCCEKWESSAELKQENKESIKKALKSMRSALMHIEQILADDL